MTNESAKTAVLHNFPGEDYEDPLITMLRKHFEVISYEQFTENQQEYRNEVRAIFVLPFCLTSAFVKEVDQLPNVKIVHSAATGTDKLDLFAKGRYRLSYSPGVYSTATADVAIGLLIAASRLFSFVPNIGSSYYFSENTFNGLPVTGKTVGIYGMGRIGLEVAKRATLGFDMKVMYHNRRRRSSEDEELVSATFCSTLDEMLPVVDHVVICAPYSPETHQVFGQKQFSLMKKTATIVNVARGPLIDTDALVEALEKGEIHAAGLDVTDPEPLPEGHSLRSLPNVYILPHQGGKMKQCLIDSSNLAIRSIKAGLADEPLPFEFIFDS